MNLDESPEFILVKHSHVQWGHETWVWPGEEEVFLFTVSAKDLPEGESLGTDIRDADEYHKDTMPIEKYAKLTKMWRKIAQLPLNELMSHDTGFGFSATEYKLQISDGPISVQFDWSESSNFTSPFEDIIALLEDR